MVRAERFLGFPETGSDPVEMHVLRPHKPRWKADSFFLCFNEGLNMLAEMDLTKTEYRVMLKLMALCRYENVVLVTQAAIADELNIQQPHVSKAIKSLEEQQLIFRSKLDGRRCIRISDRLGWKGKKGEGYRRFLEEQDQAFRTRKSDPVGTTA